MTAALQLLQWLDGLSTDCRFYSWFASINARMEFRRGWWLAGQLELVAGVAYLLHLRPVGHAIARAASRRVPVDQLDRFAAQSERAGLWVERRARHLLTWWLRPGPLSG